MVPLLQRVADPRHRHDLDPFNRVLGAIRRWDDRAPKAKLGGFPQPFLSALNGPDFAGEANLAKHQRFIA